MGKKKEFRVFYSWQSDLPKQTNLNAIRKALKAAIKRIGQEHTQLKVVADEATRDTSGSPNIALKILEKIENADVFVADITTVTQPGVTRPCPNPNVTYELGYAVGQLGWDRVILLFNQAHGDFPNDLPFDFIQQRASPYSLSESDSKLAHDKLAEFLEDAINAVISKNPKTPVELRGLSREKLEHEHDVENLTWLMSKIHLPTVDQFILDLPRVIDDRVFWFWEDFQGVVTNSLFSVYDQQLDQTIVKLYCAWQRTFQFPGRYHDAPGGRRHIFGNFGDAPLSKEQQVDWDEIEAARTEMAEALQDLLGRLRESYIEVNLRKTNMKAWNGYVEYQRAVMHEISSDVTEAAKITKKGKETKTRKKSKKK